MSGCNDFSLSWINPYYHLCLAGNSLTSGLSGGVLEGAEEGISGAAEKISKDLLEAIQQSIDGFSSRFSDMSAGEIGQKTAQAAKDFWQEFAQTSGFDPSSLSGDNLGSQAGQHVHGFFDQFLEQLKLSETTGKASNEFSEAFKEGIKNLNLKENIEEASREISPAIQKFFEEFRKNSIHEADLLRDDLQKVFANMSRDWALKNAPWLALGSAVIVGTPLLLTYLYYKAKHNIGKPKLALETRNIGLIDQAKDTIYSTVNTIWSMTKPALMYSSATIAACLTAAATVSFADLVSPLRDVAPNLVNGSWDLLGETACQWGLTNHWRCPYGSYYEGMLASSLGIGALAALYKGGSLTYNSIKDWMREEPKAIFNEKLTRAIDMITDATYNLYKHNGYFQNVLLYGPGGTGKTMIAKMMAKNSKLNYVMMSGGDLAQYIKRGEHVTELNKLFESAKNNYTPTIIFIDEAEALCKQRDKMDKSELIELLDAFLNQTGEPSKKIMLILATNRVQDLDDAVLSRMDHKLHIAPPEKAERKKILQQYIPRFFSKSEETTLFTEEVVDQIAEDTEGFTGRALFKLLNTLLGKKHASKDNVLTAQMIREVVVYYIEQEKEIAATKGTLNLQPEMNRPPVVEEAALSSTPKIKHKKARHLKSSRKHKVKKTRPTLLSNVNTSHALKFRSPLLAKKFSDRSVKS